MKKVTPFGVVQQVAAQVVPNGVQSSADRRQAVSIQNKSWNTIFLTWLMQMLLDVTRGSE